MAKPRTGTNPKPADNGSIGDQNPIVEPTGNNGGNDESQFADPGTLGNPDEYERDTDGSIKRNKDGSPRKRRGRKAGQSGGGSGGSGGGNHKARSRNNSAVDGLSATLLMVHEGLAAFTKFEDLKIDKAEGDLLAGNIANVMEQFDITPDPKIAAIAGLVSACGVVYGPRILLYRMYAAEKRKSNKNSATPFTGPIDGVIIDAPQSSVN